MDSTITEGSRPRSIDVGAANASAASSAQEYHTPRSPLKSPTSPRPPPLDSAVAEGLVTSLSPAKPSRSPLQPLQPLQHGDNATVQQASSSPVKIHTPTSEVPRASSAIIQNGDIRMRRSETPESQPSLQPENEQRADERPPSQPFTGTHVRNLSSPMVEPSDPLEAVSLPFRGPEERAGTPSIQLDGGDIRPVEQSPGLQYHHEKAVVEKQPKRRVVSHNSIGSVGSMASDSRTVSSSGDLSQDSPRSSNGNDKQTKRKSPMLHPASNLSMGSDMALRGRSLTPQEIARDSSRPVSMYSRNLSAASDARSAGGRPLSTVDLLNIPYSQQVAHQMLAIDHAKVKGAVGSNASLLDTKKTLDMYRANIRKSTDNAIQYEFAIFMITAVREASDRRQDGTGDSLANPAYRKELLMEARGILQRLADRSYPYAQYYLGDGYASGFFNNGKPDDKEAFRLFVAGGKHGHAEAAYRAALCYEFGWGSRRDVSKASQYFRSAASKGHPGAAVRLGKACLTGNMGLHGKYREGIKWLKRAAENADNQHNSGPYELGLLHINGYGEDVFKDEAYAAQLMTRSADLGHAQANLRMGEVYEHGLLGCPRDPALSIHFYNGAAQAGLPEAMMALCAWYMVGATPVLPKDEAEAYEWAKRAAGLGLAKAEYAVGYFTEMGIGCRRDPLEANTWYSRAAEQGDARAKSRLSIIREAESGQVDVRNPKSEKKMLKKKKSSSQILNGTGGDQPKDDKDCIVM
ncbi:MAG: hypothetical protein Q9162_005024 [Coniocarpon cinnabarinum]